MCQDITAMSAVCNRKWLWEARAGSDHAGVFARRRMVAPESDALASPSAELAIPAFPQD